MMIKQKQRSMRFMRPEKKYDDEVLDISRVVRVTKGGKRLSMRATIAIGDRKGKIGIGVGKASGSDVAGAITKAKVNAEKNLIYLPMIKDTIPHEVSAKYCAAKVILKPASKGHGLVSGGAVRIICDLVGIKDISSKILGGTSNKLSNARATVLALKKLKSKEDKKFRKTEEKVEDKEESVNNEEEITEE